MVLAPWEAPEPLKRAWCLFELYATVVEGKPFSVCFVPAERQKFEAALEEEDLTAFFSAVKNINVEHAQAGKEADKAMILTAVYQMEGGPSKLNKVAIEAMRDAVLGIAKDVLGSRRPGLAFIFSVAKLLDSLGLRRHQIQARAP
jgi:hypothetical protein